MSIVIVLRILSIVVLTAVFVSILSLFNLYTQLSRYKDFWEKQNERPKAKNSISYIALGDSTAQAIGASHPNKGYVSLIADQLSEQTDKPVHVTNLSKSGAKVADVVRDQIPALERLKPNDKTIITIEIGANDMINYYPNDFRSSMDELMGKLPKQTLITDIPYFGGTRYKSRESNVIEANKVMYELANKHGFKLVPLHEKIQGNNGLRTMAMDLFHPSDYSYRENWAYVFLERIKQG